MATFVDRVVLHLQAGDGGHGCVSDPPGEVQAVRRAGRRQRRARRRRPPRRRPGRAHAARLPLPAAHQGRERQGRRRAPTATAPTAQDLVLQGARRHGRADRRRARCWPTWSASAPRSRWPAAAGAGAATPRWPTPAARRPASPSWASPASQLDVVLELKSVADVGPGRLPVGRQVVADRRDLRGQARRSPTTRSPRSCPTSASSGPATTRSPSPTCRG